MSLIAGTRFPANRSRLGPFVSSDGARHALAINATGNLTLYSTTDGTTWSEASLSVSGVISASSAQIGDTLHVAVHVGTGVSTFSYDLLTRGRGGVIGLAINIANNDAISQVVDIAVEGSGALVVGYGGTGVKSMNVNYQRTFYRRSTDNGATWAAETALDAGGTSTVDWYFGGLVKGASNLIHAFLRSGTNGHHRSINAGTAGTVSAAFVTDLDSSISYAFGKGNSYVDGTVTRVRIPAIRGATTTRRAWMVQFDSVATPTITTVQVSDAAPNDAGVITMRGTTQHYLYTRNSDNAILHDTNTGTGWSTDVVRTGTGSRIAGRVNGDNLDYLYAVGTGEITYARHALVATTAFTATAAGTLPKLTGSSTSTAAVPAYTATATGTLPKLTGSATASVVSVVATATGTLPKLTGSSTASAVITDVCVIYGQVFASDELTALSAEVEVGRFDTATTTYATASLDLTGVIAGTLETYRGAKLRLRYAYTDNGGTLRKVRLTSAALDIKYEVSSTPSFTATTAGVLPKLTGSSTSTVAAPAYTARVAGILPKLTGASSATAAVPAYTATAAGVLPKLTGSATAAVVSIVARVAGTLPRLTGSSSATTAVPAYTATATGTLPKLTGSATAKVVTVTATATGTLPKLTGSAAAQSAPPNYTGTMAGIMPGLVGSSVATNAPPAYTATAAGTLPKLSGTSSASVSAPGGVSASVSATLPKLTGSSAASVALPPSVTATATGTLPKLSGASQATVAAPRFTATVTGTLPKLTGTSTATAALKATATATLPKLTGSSTASVALPPSVTATTTGTLPKLIGSSTATTTGLATTATVAATLPKLISSSTASVAAPRFTGAVSGTLPRLISSSRAELGQQGWNVTTEASGDIFVTAQHSSDWSYTVPVSTGISVTASVSTGWSVTTTAETSFNT